MAVAPLLVLSLLLLLLQTAPSARAADAPGGHPPTCSASDRAALLDFRAALSELHTGAFSTWTSADCCTGWYGVSCEPSTGRVIDITLRADSDHPLILSTSEQQQQHQPGFMSGSISPSVCRLDRLTTLILADWRNISGPIPSCVPTSLPSLRILDLVGNRLSGQIPADIGKLARLSVLNVADNQLTGSIPPSLPDLSSLMHLDLSNNQLTGPVPANFGKLRMLSRALLGRNQLEGMIPSSLGSPSLSRLADLDLSSNRIHGGIPASLGSLKVLSSLYLDGNMLIGKIPASLLRSKGLSIVNLSRNELEGPIPDVFGPESYFTLLDLSHNNLKGDLPKSLAAAKYIGHLDLSHNHLCGPIPVGSPFDHLEAASFTSNDCLCGGPLPTKC